jgi:nucleoside-diphosphate-sugar epimerase
MKILIVGGTSTVGRALIPVLSEIGEVVTAGRKNCDFHLDLIDSVEKIVLPKDIDVVINTAAHFGGNTEKEILDAENVNVLGVIKLCHAIVEAKVKHFILISSIFSNLSKESKFYNIYAISKKHSEEISSFYCKTYSVPLTILKPSQIYGDDNSFRLHQPFFYTIVDKAEKGEEINIFGSNDAHRNYIHIDDLTKIILRVVRNKVEGLYSCMYPKDVRYSQIARAAIAAFKSKGRVLFLKSEPDVSDNIFKKDDSLYKKIAFYPQISIKDGMKKIMIYRKGNHL